MKTAPMIALAAVAALGLAACSPGIHGRIGYNVDFENGELVSHAPNQPNATINADGSLRIGKRAVAITPSERALLKDYYNQSQGLMAEGKTVGKAGVELGVHAIGDTLSGLFSGKSKQAQQSIEAKANAIDASAQKLCSGLNQLRSTQQAIAAQLAAFKPYAAVGDAHCTVTTTRSINVAGSPPGSTRSIESSTAAKAH